MILRRMSVCDISQDETALDTRLKVAFATSDRRHVDQHFGTARTFAIYAVDAASSKLLELIEFVESAQSGDEQHGDSHGKLAAKLEALQGCVAIYCEAIGASAIRLLTAAEVQPVKVYRGAPIAGLIEDFQNELQTGPAAWLAKAIARRSRDDPDRFARMEAEGWDE